MKKIYYILFFAILLASCSTRENSIPNNQSISVDEYRKTEEMACLKKHGYENMKYCECLSTVKNEVIPDEMKSRVLVGDSSVIREMFLVLIKNQSRLDACDPQFAKPQVQKIDLTIPEYKVPTLAKKILADNKSAILTPENREFIKPILPIGYEFYMNYPNSKPKPSSIARLTAISKNAYFFTLINEKNTRENHKKYVNGVEYYVPMHNMNITEYSVSKNSECIFAVNRVCEFKEYSDKKIYQMYSEYRNGLWVSVEPTTYGNGRYLAIRIFGVDGLPLYIYKKSLQKGYEDETIRIETGVSWKQYLN